MFDNIKLSFVNSNRNPVIDGVPEYGADDRSRTYDRLITNQLLYQLSYISNVDPAIIQLFFNLSRFF